MLFPLEDLPYAYDALEPYVSEGTLSIHHGRHHHAYLEKLTALAKRYACENRTLEDIITLSVGRDSHRALFNNSAQAWNHSFYWKSMMPGGGGRSTGPIAKLIDSHFGGYEQFVTAFKSKAVGQFGSGWAWLVLDEDRLKVVASSNAGTPAAHGLVPLLTIDVWEHAYYLDYQNRRADYVDDFLDHLVNWEFANQNLAAVTSNWPDLSSSSRSKVQPREWL